MEMHQVRYFLAVARTLNFTRAAEDCNVSQPSLTRAIQKLEDELGGALLHRERANTHLTELGRKMLPHLERAFEAAEAAKEIATGIKKGAIAPLRLGVIGTVPPAHVMDILAKLRAAVGGIEVTLGSGGQSELVEETLDGEFDIALIGDAADWPDRLRAWRLFREPAAVVMPENHPLAGRAEITLDDLKGQPLVLRADCAFASVFRQYCEEAAVSLDARHRAKSEDQLQRLVLAGFGLAIVPVSEPLHEGLVARPFSVPDLEFGVSLATVAGRKYSPATDLFIKLARGRDWRAAT